jgi:serine/threonine protein kinase
MMAPLIKTCAKIQIDLNLQHRDLKLTNILKIHNSWYIADFGLAKIIDNANDKDSQSFAENISLNE